MQRDERGSPSGPMFDNVRTIFIMPNLPKATEDDLVEGYRWLSAELNRHRGDERLRGLIPPT